MPYRLAQDEGVVQGLRRIASEEIDSAIAHLRKEDEAARDKGIHEARKSIKKLRGLVRILMPGLGEAGSRENLRLRNTGRALSNLRDAAALIETVETLSEQHSADPAMEQLSVVRSALRRRLEQTVRGEDCRTIIGGAVASLKEVKRRMNRWQLAEGEFSVLAPGIERTYRRGRKALRKAEENPGAETLHTLRRRAKDHWYHVRLLEGAWKRDAGNREKRLEELQEWLGDDHNLTVLQEALESDPASLGGKRCVTAVLDLISRARRDVREPALQSAAELYSGTPKQHLRKSAECWENWRAGAKPAKASSGSHAKRRTSAA